MAFVSKSPWLVHYDASSCNGCDIEVLAALTPLYDAERFGVINTGNPRHADIFLVTGSVNEQSEGVIRQMYEQMVEPKVVIAVGICACSGGIFHDCYNIKGGIDKVIPVDVYVPGCSARPQAIIDGVVKAIEILEEKRTALAAGVPVPVPKTPLEDPRHVLQGVQEIPELPVSDNVDTDDSPETGTPAVARILTTPADTPTEPTAASTSETLPHDTQASTDKVSGTDQNPAEKTSVLKEEATADSGTNAPADAVATDKPADVAAETADVADKPAQTTDTSADNPASTTPEDPATTEDTTPVETSDTKEDAR